MFVSTNQNKHIMDIVANIFEKFIGAITTRKPVVKTVQAHASANPHKIGDIFVESWGYEQTNVDAYQVVKVNKSSVVLREIALDVVESTGWASDMVVPVKDSFIDEKTFVKRIRKDSYLKGFYFGYLSKHIDNKYYHRSWYA